MRNVSASIATWYSPSKDLGTTAISHSNLPMLSPMQQVYHSGLITIATLPELNGLPAPNRSLWAKLSVGIEWSTHTRSYHHCRPFSQPSGALTFLVASS